jgi:hypothetical protein
LNNQPQKLKTIQASSCVKKPKIQQNLHLGIQNPAKFALGNPKSTLPDPESSLFIESEIQIHMGIGHSCLPRDKSTHAVSLLQNKVIEIDQTKVKLQV